MELFPIASVLMTDPLFRPLTLRSQKQQGCDPRFTASMLCDVKDKKDEFLVVAGRSGAIAARSHPSPAKLPTSPSFCLALHFA